MGGTVTALKLLFAALSTGSLCALSLYILLAVRGKSELLYSTSSAATPLSWKEKTFFALAAIGFLVCMYKGAEAMLYWMPDSWGHLDSDDEYQTVRSFVALLFAAVGGLSLIGFIDKATHEKFHLRELAEWSAGQEKIINASPSLESLRYLRAEFETTIEEIRSDLRKTEIRDEWKVGLLPKGRRVQIYCELVAAIESIEKRFNHI